MPLEHERVPQCPVKACVLPGKHGPCVYHRLFFMVPWTPGQIGFADIYAGRGLEDSDPADRLNTPLYVATAKEVFARRPIVRVWRAGYLQKETDSYSDPRWGELAAKRQEFLDREHRPKPSKPNLLCVDRVILPDGSLTKTIIESTKPGTVMANHNATGAFILWKGFGKKKVRKAQRRRPAGWHGNHPAQMPVKRWSREEIDDSNPSRTDKTLRLIANVSRTPVPAIQSPEPHQEPPSGSQGGQ